MESMALSIVWALLILAYIALGLFWIRYVNRETMKNAIRWAIASATMCVLHIILFCIEKIYVFKVQAIGNFCIDVIVFGLAIYAIKRCKCK